MRLGRGQGSGANPTRGEIVLPEFKTIEIEPGPEPGTAESALVSVAGDAGLKDSRTPGEGPCSGPRAVRFAPRTSERIGSLGSIF